MSDERRPARAIHLLDPLIQVESLYRFNAKFKPGWLPRAGSCSCDCVAWFDNCTGNIALTSCTHTRHYPAEKRPGCSVAI